MLLVNSLGLEINLGKKLGSGGEGYVAEVPQSPKFVAKIYHKGLSSEKQQKLLCMAPKYNEALAQVAAWPADVLHDKKSKVVRGFLMENLASYTPIHSIYSPVERKQKYPNHDWAFLINVARNVASAFTVIHQHGIIIGDVNQNSVSIVSG